MKRRAAKLVLQKPTERPWHIKCNGPSHNQIGRRLELARRALDLTQFQMARLLGTDMATWGTYEAGLERIPPEQAVKLSAYGIPLDWIYRGRTTNLPTHIRAEDLGGADPDLTRALQTAGSKPPRHGLHGPRLV